jgi:hypothetical protein
MVRGAMQGASKTLGLCNNSACLTQQQATCVNGSRLATCLTCGHQEAAADLDGLPDRRPNLRHA